VKAYVLRYWETEFPAIAPKKSGTGQRLYRRKDVELILEIKHLLYEKRFTIEGARKAIEDRAKPVAAPKRVPKAVATTQTSLFGTPGPDLSAIRRELEGHPSDLEVGQGPCGPDLRWITATHRRRLFFRQYETAAQVQMTGSLL
jgi:DNA-binding transcriptional MerR regulator